MKLQGILLAAACAVAPMTSAQQAATPVLSLKATVKAEWSLSHPAVMIGRAMCDGAGNVYTRQLDVEASKDKQNLYRLPIQKITPEGDQAGYFRVTNAFPEDVMGKAIFVDQDGRVYQIAMAHGGVYVVEFGQNGSVKAKTKLDVDSHLVIPRLLAVFKSGEYMLIGETGKDARAPFTAVFGVDGRLLKKIYEPEDEEARRKAEFGDREYAASNIENRFVSFGDAAAGSDGNVYVLRGTSPTQVYVISPAGEVVRKLRIDGGSSELGARIKLYDGRLAVWFDGPSGSDQYLIKVLDLQGNSIADYAVGDSEINPLALACYGSEGFTMINESAETKFHLVKAKVP